MAPPSAQDAASAAPARLSRRNRNHHQDDPALRSLSQRPAPQGQGTVRTLEDPDLHRWPALRWVDRALRRRRPDEPAQVSCLEVMTAYLDHIDIFNPRVNAIISMQPREASLAEARERDAQLARGEYLGWMHGFPHAVKDNTPVKGMPFTRGSPLFKDFIAPADAIVVERMKSAGAIVIGKTNMPEFALGSQTHNTVFGTTLNPYDLSKTCGGSSGGAGVAVALR